MLLNCGVGEDSWESHGLQGDHTSQERNQSWIVIERTNAAVATSILWPPEVKNWLCKRSWCWESWRQEEQETAEDEMVSDEASLTQWTWVSASSGGWWWTGKPGVLQSVELQIVRQELSDWNELIITNELQLFTSGLHFTWESNVTVHIINWIRLSKIIIVIVKRFS